MNVDLHTHTKYSYDAVCPPDKFIKAVMAKGLNAVAITDHNTTKGWKAMTEAGRKYNIPVIQGEEIRLIENAHSRGELIGLFLNEAIRPGTPLEVIDAIRAQGGLIIVPHPFDAHRKFHDIGQYVKMVDGIEVLNARAFKDSNNTQALVFAQKHKLAQTGGSDAHTCREIGNAYTYAPATTLEELRKAIIKKTTEAQGKRSSAWVHAVSTLAKIKKL